MPQSEGLKELAFNSWLRYPRNQMECRSMMPKEDVEFALAEAFNWSEKLTRLGRGIAYFIVTALLLSVNTYNIPSTWTLAFALGLFGLMGTCANIARACLAVLAAMAVFPSQLLYNLFRMFT
jgi:hypothetical protein